MSLTSVIMSIMIAVILVVGAASGISALGETGNLAQQAREVALIAADDWRERYTHSLTTTYTCREIGTASGQVDPAQVLTFGDCQVPGLVNVSGLRTREQVSSCTGANIADMRSPNVREDALDGAYENWFIRWQPGRLQAEILYRHPTKLHNGLPLVVHSRLWLSPLTRETQRATYLTDARFPHATGEMTTGRRDGLAAVVGDNAIVLCSDL